MNKKILAALLLSLIVLMPSALAVPNNEEHSKDKMNAELAKILSQRQNPKQIASASVAEAKTGYPQIIEYQRNGIVCCNNIAKYTIIIQAGPGEYDILTVTEFVRETQPWRTNAVRLLLMSPGESVNDSLFDDKNNEETLAVYEALQGKNVFILGRREENVPPEETNFQFMAQWTPELYLNDMYVETLISKLQAKELNAGIGNIRTVKTTGLGYSLGAWLVTEYEASDYDDYPLGNFDIIIPMDIVIKFDPAETTPIETQKNRYDFVKQQMDSGKLQNDEMAGLSGLSYLAKIDPEGESPIMPPYTNMYVWLSLITATYAFDPFPYTPDFHYLTGDPVNGLYYADSQRVMDFAINALPYTPYSLDLRLAGLEGNVAGYDINAAKVDSRVCYVGMGGGFGPYGNWWYSNIVGQTNPDVTIINWADGGHAAGTFDNRASTELWPQIDACDR